MGFVVQIYVRHLSHLCQNISYVKEQHPQGNHLHQQQGGVSYGIGSKTARILYQIGFE